MTNHIENRPRTGRKLRVAMLCAGILVLGACSDSEEVPGVGGNASATTAGNDATTVPATITTTITIDANTVKDAIRNALEGSVRVTGSETYVGGEEENFTLNVDAVGNWSMSGSSLVMPYDDTRSEFRSVNGAFYHVLDTHAADESESFVWVRNDMPDLNLAPELLHITLLEDLFYGNILDLGEQTPGPEWLNIRDRFLDAADISSDQTNGNWLLTWTDDDGDAHTIDVALDADGRIVSLLNMEQSYTIEYDRSADIAPIGAPETYLEGEDASRAVWLSTFALMTREEARAIIRNAEAIAASEGGGVLDTHFEAAFGEASCGKDCSFDLATKTFSVTELGFTCSTTLIPADDGWLVASRPVCVRN